MLHSCGNNLKRISCRASVSILPSAWSTPISCGIAASQANANSVLGLFGCPQRSRLRPARSPRRAQSRRQGRPALDRPHPGGPPGRNLFTGGDTRRAARGPCALLPRTLARQRQLRGDGFLAGEQSARSHSCARAWPVLLLSAAVPHSRSRPRPCCPARIGTDAM